MRMHTKLVLNFFSYIWDGKRTETRIGMEGICITHSCIPLYVLATHTLLVYVHVYMYLMMCLLLCLTPLMI